MNFEPRRLALLPLVLCLITLDIGLALGVGQSRYVNPLETQVGEIGTLRIMGIGAVAAVSWCLSTCMMGEKSGKAVFLGICIWYYIGIPCIAWKLAAGLEASVGQFLAICGFTALLALSILFAWRYSFSEDACMADSWRPWTQRLPLVAILLSIMSLDVALTLINQPAGYWNGTRTHVDEANPLVVGALASHPAMFVVVTAVFGMLASLFICLAWQWASQLAFLFLACAHLYAASTWLLNLQLVGPGFGLGLTAVMILVFSMLTPLAWHRAYLAGRQSVVSGSTNPICAAFVPTSFGSDHNHVARRASTLG